ncbi:egg-lysin-like [Haliotis asinina]|uniref:egg-lysin-like n=1 Tax=Haliotis asinina TaxID=109174 RepID=UPI0035322ACB
MRTVVLFCVIMVAVSVSHGRHRAGRRAQRYLLSKKNDYALKAWITHYFDKQLARFLKMTKGWLKISRTQVKVLLYMNRQHVVRNCNFYRTYATDTLKRFHLRLTVSNYRLMGRRIGRRIQMGWRYYRMISKRQLPKFSKRIEKVLASK